MANTRIPHSNKDVGSIPSWVSVVNSYPHITAGKAVIENERMYKCKRDVTTVNGNILVEWLSTVQMISQHGDVSTAKTPNPQNAPEATASMCDCKRE